MENQQFGSSSPRHGVWSDGFVAVQHDMRGIEHIYYPTISHPQVIRVSYLLLNHWYPLQRPLLNLYFWAVPISGVWREGSTWIPSMGVDLLGHSHFASWNQLVCPGEFCPFKHVQAEKNTCLVPAWTNQPILKKYANVKMDASSPIFGVNLKITDPPVN